MDDEAIMGRGQPHRGRALGDFEELVGHDETDQAASDGPAPRVRKLVNPVTYRCAFCGESFVSRAMIRRHLASHASVSDEAGGRAA